MTVIEDFIKFLELEKRLSIHTVDAYRSDLEQFFAFIEEHHEGVAVADLNFQLIRTWIVSMSEAQLSPRSINRKISTLKSFFKYAKGEGWIKTNPAYKIKSLKQPKRIVRDVPEKDLEKLFDESIYEDSFEGKRDRVMMELFYQTGIRRAELINIRLGDINYSDCTLKVLGKGNKERIVLFTPSLNVCLLSYVEERKKMSVIDVDHLFITARGKKLYPELVYDRVNKYLSEVSSVDKKSPHVLRHSFATHMLNKGADLNTIKELLGHANLNATQIYTHASIEKIKSVYNQTHPRGHKNE